MPKRISKALLCTLLIAIAALFAASEVIAFCDNCDPGASLHDPVIAGPYTIKLVSIEIIDSTYNRLNYTVENTSNPGTLTGLNFFAMLIPDCCNEPFITFDLNGSIPNNLKYLPVAVGEPTLNFGQYNQQARVLKGTPDNDTIWSLVTTSKTLTTTTALLKYGQGKGDKVSVEIPGPGCAKVEYCPKPKTRVEPRSQCWQFTAETDQCGVASTWYVEWTEAGGECAVKAWACDGIVDCGKVKDNAGGIVTVPETEIVCWELDAEPLFDIVTTDNETLDAALTGNSQCPELWLRFVDDIGCNERCYVSGGVKYCCRNGTCKPE